MHDDFACTATGDSFCQYNFLKIHVEVALIDICREYGLDVQAPTLDGRSQKSVAVVAVGVAGRYLAVGGRWWVVGGRL